MISEWTIRFVATIAVGVISQSSAAQNVSIPGVTLEDFFTAAINFSPDLKIAEETVKISSARRRAANGQLLPQVSAGANVSDNRLNQSNRFLEYRGERYGLSLSQTLFN